MRFNVHNSLGKPHAIAPASSSFWSFSRCFAVSFEGRPGVGLATNPASPSLFQSWSQRWTAPGEARTRRAISRIPFPSLESFMARRRRFSRLAADPMGLMHHSIDSFYYLRNTQYYAAFVLDPDGN